ncbi:MAG: response regulator [Oscillatoriales cyanobacterium C42_A2020_001]|nr:response regulator [Leptolyngbyaceae cyanobacterium C42_A2020_001]
MIRHPLKLDRQKVTFVKILVVEDEKLVADDLQETLTLLGYEVPVLLTSGEEAIAQVHAIQPDLVLMDICLAGAIDGIEASKIIQAQHHIPIVYLTANADSSTLDRAKVSQPFGFIVKPFSEKVLSTTIEIALSRHQAELAVYTALANARFNQQCAEDRFQQKTEYLGLVAHELRNPLTVIKFAVELLHSQEQELSKEKRQQYLQRIYAATKNLDDLLKDVLVLEKTTAEDLSLTPEAVELVSFCHEMVETFQVTSGEQHHFVFASERERQVLQLDTKLLWHLLNNLLSNAIKYSPEQSTISLMLSWKAGAVIIQISDEGVGIPSESLPRLFTPFHRARNVTHLPGTGLGLAIAKKCVELQGGQIVVQSEVEKGTQFTITFPCL